MRRIRTGNGMLKISSVKTIATIAFIAALVGSLEGFPRLFDALGWATPDP